MSPEDALEYVRANAGASKVRDAVDTFLIETELLSYGTTGIIISDPDSVGGPGTIDGGTVSGTSQAC